jgi:hypothetical protein
MLTRFIFATFVALLLGEYKNRKKEEEKKLRGRRISSSLPRFTILVV